MLLLSAVVVSATLFLVQELDSGGESVEKAALLGDSIGTSLAGRLLLLLGYEGLFSCCKRRHAKLVRQGAISTQVNQESDNEEMSVLCGEEQRSIPELL